MIQLVITSSGGIFRISLVIQMERELSVFLPRISLLFCTGRRGERRLEDGRVGTSVWGTTALLGPIGATACGAAGVLAPLAAPWAPSTCVGWTGKFCLSHTLRIFL